MTDAELAHLIVDGGIATITLDSPHNRNALSCQLVSELTDRLQSAETDARVRAVVLTLTATAFCAGADLSDARTGSMTGTASTLLRLIRGLIDTPQTGDRQDRRQRARRRPWVDQRVRHRGGRTALQLRTGRCSCGETQPG